ncbi:class I SAM-dependent methyltransferase [Actinomadura keratinilytica]|uniref:class I SAM-dependent methyltransferase n=1 Tax=Actinomadura keratinilytica TaxID=547461 RepID=UPI0036099146
MALPATPDPVQDYWNHNTHYHDVVLSAVPRGCRAALDVGCGDGLLVRRLAPRAEHVTGVDASAEMVARARELSAGLDNVEFVEADFLDYDVPRERFDFVCSVAAIHHMDFTAALTAMRDALRPGGAWWSSAWPTTAGRRTCCTTSWPCRRTTSTGGATGTASGTRTPRSPTPT